MKILIIGGGGMLGHKLVQKLSDKFDVWVTIRNKLNNYKEFKIFDKKRTFENIRVEEIDEISKVIKKVKPDVVINAVGIIKQLPTSKDIVQTLLVNSIFPQRLAELTKTYNTRLITVSTDCVFSGTKGNYTEEDAADALDLYGRSKLFGEVVSENCLVIRTSIIGRELFTRHSLLEWFLSMQGGKIRGYKNAVFSGFPTIILADIIANLITTHKNLAGLYHLSSEPINKYDLLTMLKKKYDSEIEIEPYEDFFIDRSLDSTKFRNATGFKPKSWREMIEIMGDDKTLYQK